MMTFEHRQALRSRLFEIMEPIIPTFVESLIKHKFPAATVEGFKGNEHIDYFIMIAAGELETLQGDDMDDCRRTEPCRHKLRHLMKGKTTVCCAYNI